MRRAFSPELKAIPKRVNVVTRPGIERVCNTAVLIACVCNLGMVAIGDFMRLSVSQQHISTEESSVPAVRRCKVELA
jgi:hypothetical protein